MKIKVIVPYADGGYQTKEIEVDPNTSIKTALAPFLEDFKKVIPSYLEPVCYAGKEVPVNQGRTFEQCEVKHGDVLHGLLRIRQIKVIIDNVISKRKFSLESLSSTSIGQFKEIMHAKKIICSDVSPDRMVLKLPDSTGEFISNTKTLGELCPAENKVEFQLSVQYNIFVSVPTYGNLEKIVAKVGDTLSTIKENIKEIHTCLDQVHPIVRGAFRNVRGCCTYLYLDLFSIDSYIYVDDTAENLTPTRFRILIKDFQMTLEQVYQMIESRLHQRINEETEWATHYALGSSAAKTFFPQLEKEVYSLSERKDLNLYFFPLKSHRYSYESLNAELTIGELMKNQILNHPHIRILTERILCAPHPNITPIADSSPLSTLHIPFTSVNEEPRTLHLRKPLVRKGGIKVNVQLPTLDKFVVDANPPDNIFTLKDRIEDALGIPISLQELSFNEDVLEDNRILRFIGIIDGSVVQLRRLSSTAGSA